MELLKALQPYLYSPNDTICHQLGPEQYRLSFDEKLRIEDAIRKHGAEALQNVTKGGAMLYLRSVMRFAGADELYLRSLFDPDSVKWTGLGVHESVERSPLEGLPHPSTGWPIKEEKLALAYGDSPEKIALSLLSQNGWSGTHTEGNTIRCLFRAILLPLLIEKNPYAGVDAESTPYCHAIHFLIPMTAIGLEGLLKNRRDVPRRAIDEMHKFIGWRLHQPLHGIQDDFERVCAAHRLVWPKTPETGVDPLRYLSAMPTTFWHGLLDIYARNDGTLRSGWPDLEMTSGKEIEMVEVKVKDRLTVSQKQTMPILMGLGVRCRIVRLLNTDH